MNDIAEKMLIVMTRTWPGGWRKGLDEKSLVRDLKSEWRMEVEDYGYKVHEVHPRSYVGDMGEFVWPTGHEPKLIKTVDGRKNKPGRRRAA